MADLAQILGAVLRDVTHSRVISDIFSRDVSREYQKDPVLVEFPVPRLELKEASIQLRFAVNALDRKRIDLPALSLPILRSQVALLGKEIRNDVIAKSPERDQVLKVLSEKGLDPEQGLPAAIERAALSDAKAFEAALEGQPATLARNVRNALDTLLLGDPTLRKMLIRGTKLTAVREALRAKATAMVERFLREVSESRVDFEQRALSVDAAVTRKDLAEVPESILSQITLTTQIRNYEWSETGEADGKPIWRLRPE